MPGKSACDRRQGVGDDIEFVGQTGGTSNAAAGSPVVQRRHIPV